MIVHVVTFGLFEVMRDVYLPYWFIPACWPFWAGVGVDIVPGTLVSTGTSDAGVYQPFCFCW
jgi:hypothetical protein